MKIKQWLKNIYTFTALLLMLHFVPSPIALAECCLGDVLRNVTSPDPNPPFATPQFVTIVNQTGKPLNSIFLQAVNREFIEDDPSRFQLQDQNYELHKIGNLKPGGRKTVQFSPQQNQMTFIYQDFKLVFDSPVIYTKPPFKTTKAKSNYCTKQPSTCIIFIHKEDLEIVSKANQSTEKGPLNAHIQNQKTRAKLYDTVMKIGDPRVLKSIKGVSRPEY